MNEYWCVLLTESDKKIAAFVTPEGLETDEYVFEGLRRLEGCIWMICHL